MDNNGFHCIRGEVSKGRPAHIYFYSDVDKWSVSDFTAEFKYLTGFVEPSEIWVHINSGGGSCLDGIGVFSLVLASPIPTRTVNDGVAASMGSVIWAAGKETYMRDYSLLMLHNPFAEAKDDATRQVVEAFKSQLRIIYTRRFGLSDDEVTAIMDGKEGEDGTWMTAATAVEKGFVNPSHVIETPEAVKSRIAASVGGITDAVEACRAMGGVIGSVPQLPMVSAKKNNSSTHINMNEQLMVVAALLGLSGADATQEKVSSGIKGLLDIQSKHAAAVAEIKQLKDSVAAMQTKLAGSEASVANLTKNLTEAKAALQGYRDAEAKALEASVNALVEDAIKSCKIGKEARESWVTMAKSDFALAKSTLDSIPARDDIASVIANDPANKQGAGQSPVEKEIQEKVKAAVGDFKFLEPEF